MGCKEITITIHGCYILVGCIYQGWQLSWSIYKAVIHVNTPQIYQDIVGPNLGTSNSKTPAPKFTFLLTNGVMRYKEAQPLSLMVVVYLLVVYDKIDNLP